MLDQALASLGHSGGPDNSVNVTNAIAESVRVPTVVVTVRLPQQRATTSLGDLFGSYTAL